MPKYTQAVEREFRKIVQGMTVSEFLELASFQVDSFGNFHLKRKDGRSIPMSSGLTAKEILEISGGTDAAFGMDMSPLERYERCANVRLRAYELIFHRRTGFTEIIKRGMIRKNEDAGFYLGFTYTEWHHYIQIWAYPSEYREVTVKNRCFRLRRNEKSIVSDIKYGINMARKEAEKDPLVAAYLRYQLKSTTFENEELPGEY